MSPDSADISPVYMLPPPPPSLDVGGIAELARILLSDTKIPKELSGFDGFWGFLDSEMALSNFTPQDIERILLYYDDARLAYLMSKPYYKYTFEDDRNLTQVYGKVFAKTKRSGGGFERRMLATQITQNISTSPDHKKGMLARMFGR